jgi:hypothetical protein
LHWLLSALIKTQRVLCHLVDHQKLSFIGEQGNKKLHSQTHSTTNAACARSLCLLCSALKKRSADGGTLTDRRQCHAFFSTGRADKSGPDYCFVIREIGIRGADCGRHVTICPVSWTLFARRGSENSCGKNLDLRYVCAMCIANCE